MSQNFKAEPQRLSSPIPELEIRRLKLKEISQLPRVTPSVKDKYDKGTPVNYFEKSDLKM